MRLCFGRTAADISILCSPVSSTLPFLRIPGCDGISDQFHPKRYSQQLELVHEPSADAEPQHPHTFPLPLAHFTHQHPRSLADI